MSKDQGGTAEGYGRLQELQRQIDDLRKAVGNVAQAAALENIVQQGFANLSNQLEPLRDMSAEREYPSPEAIENLRRVQTAVRHPRWQGSDFKADGPRNDDNCKRSMKP